MKFLNLTLLFEQHTFVSEKSLKSRFCDFEAWIEKIDFNNFVDLKRGRLEPCLKGSCANFYADRLDKKNDRLQRDKWIENGLTATQATWQVLDHLEETGSHYGPSYLRHVKNQYYVVFARLRLVIIKFCRVHCKLPDKWLVKLDKTVLTERDYLWHNHTDWLKWNCTLGDTQFRSMQAQGPLHQLMRRSLSQGGRERIFGVRVCLCVCVCACVCDI